jgi:hypothetical protein
MVRAKLLGSGLLVTWAVFLAAPAAAVQVAPLSPPGNDYAPFHDPREIEPWPHEGREEFEERQGLRQAKIEKVLNLARRFLGKRRIVVRGRSFHWDCANYIRAIHFHLFDVLGYPGGPKTRSGVRRIWYFAKKRGGVHFRRIPLVGDLIFFHQTYDSNGNRRADDYYTHIAIVERVDKDGTITYIDRAVNGIARRKMNLFYPDHVRSPRGGKVVNSNVRPRRRWDEKGAKYLSGQLFAGFATLIR